MYCPPENLQQCQVAKTAKSTEPDSRVEGSLSLLLYWRCSDYFQAVFTWVSLYKTSAVPNNCVRNQEERCSNVGTLGVMTLDFYFTLIICRTKQKVLMLLEKRNSKTKVLLLLLSLYEFNSTPEPRMYPHYEGNRIGDISPSWGQPNTRVLIRTVYILFRWTCAETWYPDIDKEKNVENRGFGSTVTFDPKAHKALFLFHCVVAEPKMLAFDLKRWSLMSHSEVYSISYSLMRPVLAQLSILIDS